MNVKQTAHSPETTAALCQYFRWSSLLLVLFPAFTTDLPILNEKKKNQHIFVLTSAEWFPSCYLSYPGKVNFHYPTWMANNWVILSLHFLSVIFFFCRVLIHMGLHVQQPCCYVMVCPHHNTYLPILPAFLISLAIKSGLILSGSSPSAKEETLALLWFHTSLD